MALFDDVFNKATIYEMLFFNVKAVLIYPTLFELKEGNPALFERWKYISESKFNQSIDDVIPVSDIITNEYGQIQLYQNHVYQEKAVYYPEYSKILAITYATLRSENGQLKRDLRKIVNGDEFTVIATFMDILTMLSSEGVKSSPHFFPTLCGHNIMNYDIPMLIKRFLIHRSKFENKTLPLLLKKSLDSKPWESKIIDSVNVWKFNGNDYTPLMLIADYLGLKKTVDLDALPVLSTTYWETLKESPEKALEYISLQSATQTNLVVQLINELRQL